MPNASSEAPHSQLTSLFEETKLGDLRIANRVVMPALTRCRAAPDGTITKDQVEYYEKRASAGMMVTEPSAVSPFAHGYGKAPGLYDPKHAEGWKLVTSAVHAKGGTIVAQLWHTGRMSHSSFLPADGRIVAPSSIRVGEEADKTDAGVKALGVQAKDGSWQVHEVPHELSVAEVEGIVEDFGKAAALAVSAGFDGIEIHAGGGYLIDTFLQSATNLRKVRFPTRHALDKNLARSSSIPCSPHPKPLSPALTCFRLLLLLCPQDKYGGDATKRATFLLDILKRVSRELPLSRVGVRLTPNSGFNGMGAADNGASYATIVTLLEALGATSGSGLAYLHVQDGIGKPGSMPSFYGKISSDGFHKKGAAVTLKDLRPLFSGGLIGNGTYTAETADAAIAAGIATAVSFGRYFIGNADVVERLRAGQDLAPPPPNEAWFGASTKQGVSPAWGYTDLAPLKQRTKVLHMLGSPASDYYEQLSTMYAQGCVNSCGPTCADDYEFVFAIVHADGPSWSFPTSLEPSAIAKAPRVPISEGLLHLAALKADVAQSHMFCVQGVSTYRAILDMLGVPFIGGSVDAMTLTTHKGRSKAVAAAAGVPCAASETLRAGDKPTLSFPYIVKPCSEDNSMGISVVRDASQVDAALAEAFTFDDEVLCEAFVPPGREIRFAVLETGEVDANGTPKLVALPGVEYFMSEEKPIRTSNDKLTADKSGKLTFSKPARACPANIDPTLQAKLVDAATKAHFALGCRDYSLYDFRIDPEGNPFFLGTRITSPSRAASGSRGPLRAACVPVAHRLWPKLTAFALSHAVCPSLAEASLFCCFAANSVISMMADATGRPDLEHQRLFKTLLARALERKPESREAGGIVQALGSKQKKQKVAGGA